MYMRLRNAKHTRKCNGKCYDAHLRRACNNNNNNNDNIIQKYEENKLHDVCVRWISAWHYDVRHVKSCYTSLMEPVGLLEKSVLEQSVKSKSLI